MNGGSRLLKLRTQEREGLQNRLADIDGKNPFLRRSGKASQPTNKTVNSLDLSDDHSRKVMSEVGV